MAAISSSVLSKSVFCGSAKYAMEVLSAYDLTEQRNYTPEQCEALSVGVTKWGIEWLKPNLLVQLADNQICAMRVFSTPSKDDLVQFPNNLMYEKFSNSIEKEQTRRKATDLRRSIGQLLDTERAKWQGKK